MRKVSSRARTYTMHSELASKVANAKLHGAAAVLLVNDLPNHPGDEDRLEPFTPAMGTEDYGLPVVQLSLNGQTNCSPLRKKT